MNLFKYILCYSFICVSVFSAAEERGNGSHKVILRIPSADDSGLGSDEEARTNSRHTTPSPELFASPPPQILAANSIPTPLDVLASDLEAHPNLFVPATPPQSPLLPAQKMEENDLLRAIDSFLHTPGLSEDDREIASEIKFFVQQKRALLALCGAYGKRYPHVAYLFNDLSDHVRKNEDSYWDMKTTIFGELSKRGLTEPTLKQMATNTYEYEQRCRDAVGRIALLSQRWGKYSVIYNLLGNRGKLISNNRLLVLFPLA